jgi:hypothetical protein
MNEEVAIVMSNVSLACTVLSATCGETSRFVVVSLRALPETVAVSVDAICEVLVLEAVSDVLRVEVSSVPVVGVALAIALVLVVLARRGQ